MSTKQNAQNRGNYNDTKSKRGSVKKKSRNNGKRRDVSSNGKDNIKPASTNDPMWYAKDMNILNDVASMPFSWATGAKYNLHNPLFPNKEETMPGLCAIYLRPTFGRSTDMTSPLNQASISHYSYVRHANSGHANYDAVDLTLYIGAVSQVFSYINFLIRVLKVNDLYSWKNYYYPDSILKAMGVDPSSIRMNYANFHAGLNNLILSAAKLAAPTDMTIFNRQAMLYSDIYSGGPSSKDQLYMYTPVAFYKYGIDATGAGCLIQELFYDGTYKSWSDLINFGFSLLNCIGLDEDLGIINGDIQKAYGDNIFKVSTVGDLRGYSPLYDPLVLHQMLNATIVGADSISCEVHQSEDKGALISNPQLRFNSTSQYYFVAPTYLEDKVLTVNGVQPNPAIVLETSRLTLGCKDVSTDTDRVYDLYCGSEIAVACYIYELVNGNPVWNKYVYANPIQMNPDHYSGDIAALSNQHFKVASVRSRFKYAPKLSLITLDGETPIDQYDFFDVDNYTILNNEDIDKMHHAALMHELYVPSVGWLN